MNLHLCTASVLAILLVFGWRPCLADEAAAQPAPAASVGRYELFEISLTTDETLANPFLDAKISAVFTSPEGRKVTVPGFYFGENKWMVRFAPDQLGKWTYTAKLAGKAKTVTASGTLQCVPSERHGFLRISKINPYRLQYDDGTPFYPIGVHMCGMLQVGFDGPPASPGVEWRSVDLDTWCKAFAGAVNLNRLQLGLGNTAGCAKPILKAINDGVLEFDLDLAAQVDEAYRIHHEYGLSQILVLYQDMSLWGNPKTVFGRGRDTKHYKNLKAENLPLQEQYIRYIVARYGAFVDIWEIFNEDSYAPDDYLAHLAKVIRDADPYDHIITTNYERPLAPWCEMVTPHEYMGMPAKDVDAHLGKEFARFKSFGKPVLYTEFGNQGQLSNYDPIKWRIATWTAFMNECGILFWNMSGKKVSGLSRGNANAYLGPESRQYFRVLREFTKDLPIDMRPVAAGYTEQTDIRTYGLSNGKVTVVYVRSSSTAGSTRPPARPSAKAPGATPGRSTRGCRSRRSGSIWRAGSTGWTESAGRALPADRVLLGCGG